MDKFKEAIKTYLDKRASEDTLFATAYAKENKNLDDCCRYIVGQARKRGGTTVVMTDEDVYGLAVHYYDEDNLKIPSKIEARVTTPKSDAVKLTKKDKERLRAEAEDAYRAEELSRTKKLEQKRKEQMAARRAEENKRLFATSLFD